MTGRLVVDAWLRTIPTDHRATCPTLHPERHQSMTTTPEQARTGEIVDVAAFLAGHLNGRTIEQLSAEFHQLLDAVREHGKKGSLTITLIIDPPANGVESAPLPIGVESAIKAPKAQQPKSLYFLDADGNPVRDDPRQATLPFHSVPAPTTFKDAN